MHVHVCEASPHVCSPAFGGGGGGGHLTHSDKRVKHMRASIHAHVNMGATVNL